MSDRRLIPSNGRVAATSLIGKVHAERYVEGAARQLTLPVANLLRAPGGPRDRQLLWGDVVDVYEERAGWSFVQSRKDGYVGYLETGQLGQMTVATHVVRAPSTHVYSTSDFKSLETMTLSFGARVCVVAGHDLFLETAEGGFVPLQHLAPIESIHSDPAFVAELFLGTPYLWGGNSRNGIDCSGLIQAAFLACGVACDGDSDLQSEQLGEALPAGSAFERNDLLFWRGHVALVVDDAMLIHANAHHMAVQYEQIGDAISRIKTQGDGQVTGHRRVPQMTLK